MCHGLDDQVEVFGNRPFEGVHPYPCLDAKIKRVRGRGARAGASDHPRGARDRVQGFRVATDDQNEPNQKLLAEWRAVWSAPGAGVAQVGQLTLCARARRNYRSSG